MSHLHDIHGNYHRILGPFHLEGGHFFRIYPFLYHDFSLFPALIYLVPATCLYLYPLHTLYRPFHSATYR